MICSGRLFRWHFCHFRDVRESCWGSLLFCSERPIWPILKHSFSLWSRNNPVNLHPIIMNFSNNFSATWQRGILPNAWTPHELQLWPLWKKTQWITADFSGILKVFKGHYSLKNVPKYCQLMVMPYFHAAFKDTYYRLSFISQNCNFIFFTGWRIFQEVKKCKERESRRQFIEMNCLIFLHRKQRKQNKLHKILSVKIIRFYTQY